jgi:hypothetical protein
MHDYRLKETDGPQRHPDAVDRLTGKVERRRNWGEAKKSS